ncbi:MAG: hypothetical protein LLF96_05280 [Eubacteriales bacterium]|nr:hypothetical protein [Eubacteriales bacterium]
MEQILIEYEFPSPSVALLGKTMQAYERRYATRIVMKKGSQITRSDIAGCTAYVSVRGNASLSATLMKTAQKMGKPCLAFVDDDFLLLKKAGAFPARRKKHFRTVLENANALLCVNPLLEEKYTPYTLDHRSICFDPILPDDAFVGDAQIGERHADTVSILYAANATHAIFFQKYITPVLKNVARQVNKPLRLVFMGVRPQLDPQIEGISAEYYGVQAYDVYRKRLLAGGFAIGVAPLEPNEFTSMKYYNKFIDYASAGISGIYTDCAPYTMVVESGRNGLLCKAESAAWEKALVTMVNDDALRMRCAQNALADARRLCSEERNLELVRQGFLSLEGCKHKSVGFVLPLGFARLFGRAFVLAEHAEKACGIAVHAGFPTLLKKIASHVRARKAFTSGKTG